MLKMSNEAMKSLNIQSISDRLFLRKAKFMFKVYHDLDPTYISDTVMIRSFRTDMPGQTVQTQIRLLLEEQSDQCLHCLPFRLHRLDSLLYGRATQFKF